MGEIWRRAFFKLSYVWLSSRVSPPTEFHTDHSVTNRRKRGLDGEPRLEYLKCLICVSSKKAGDPCTSSLSFRVPSLEAACSCPRLFTAGGIHRGKEGKKPKVFEQ